MCYLEKLFSCTSTPLLQNRAKPPLGPSLSTVTMFVIPNFHLNHSIHFPSCFVSARKRMSGASCFWTSRSPRIDGPFPNPRQFQVISLIFAREAAPATPRFLFSSFWHPRDHHWHPRFAKLLRGGKQWSKRLSNRLSCLSLHY